MTEAGGGGKEGLDANELSEKLATIPVDDGTDEGGETERPFISENSSTAAIFGSDGGMGTSEIRVWSIRGYRPLMIHNSMM